METALTNICFTDTGVMVTWKVTTFVFLALWVKAVWGHKMYKMFKKNKS